MSTTVRTAHMSTTVSTAHTSMTVSTAHMSTSNSTEHNEGMKTCQIKIPNFFTMTTPEMARLSANYIIQLNEKRMITTMNLLILTTCQCLWKKKTHKKIKDLHYSFQIMHTIFKLIKIIKISNCVHLPGTASRIFLLAEAVKRLENRHRLGLGVDYSGLPEGTAWKKLNFVLLQHHSDHVRQS